MNYVKDPDPHKVRRWIRIHPQVVVYSCLVLVIVFVLGLDQYNQMQDQKNQCLAGVDSRNVDRAQVQEIYKLNLSFIEPGQKYTDEEIRRINEFLKNISEFRSRMYAQIKPSVVCAPYVDDDNVKPPKTPKPPIIR